MSKQQHPTSNHFHLVLSPKDCPEPALLINWLKTKTLNHILSLEKGTNGHDHLDCFYELKTNSRPDHQKRAILSLYPDIPVQERKNVRVCINTVDPTPSYGYGYSLKEGNVLSTTFDEFEHADFLNYYLEHSEKVKQSLLKTKPKTTNLTIDQIGEGCISFVREYFDGKCIGNTPITWLVLEYLKSVAPQITLSVYHRLNVEKIVGHVEINLGARLLTAPSSSPPTSNPNSINNPLLNHVSV